MSREGGPVKVWLPEIIGKGGGRGMQLTPLWSNMLGTKGIQTAHRKDFMGVFQESSRRAGEGNSTFLSSMIADKCIH